MLNQITKFRLPDGTEIALVDWTDKPLWSSLEVLHGSTQQDMPLFQYTVGDAVPTFAPGAATPRTSDETDTNLSTPGAMASTEEFLVFALRPEVFRLQVASLVEPVDFNALLPLAAGEPNPTPAMLGAMHLQCTLQLEISEKIYSQAGFGYYNFGGGVYGFTADATTVGVGQKGFPSHEAVQAFSIPQHIGGQEKYRVTLRNPPGAALQIGVGGVCEEGGCDTEQTARFARVRVYMDGLYKRPTS